MHGDIDRAVEQSALQFLGENAVAADLRPASVTELLDGLADRDLVQRTRSDKDRRVVLTSLTERGRALVEQRQARFEPRFRAAMAEFSEEQLLIAAGILDRLAGMFDELAEELRREVAAVRAAMARDGHRN